MSYDYIDAMDHTREVRFESLGGKGPTIKGRVFYEGVYQGKADIPRKLILSGNEDPDRNQLARIGFFPASLLQKEEDLPEMPENEPWDNEEEDE